MSIYSTLLLAGFFFIMGGGVVGIIWYLQSIARGASGKGKNASPIDPNLAEVARLLRDTQTQDLVVGINGQTFRKAHELNPGQTRRLNFASNVLAKWLVETAPTSQTEEEPATLPPEAALQEDEWIPAETAPEEARHSHTSPFMAEPVEAVKPVSTNLPDMVGNLLNPAPKPAPEFKSIAMQINDILQEMMVGTPFEKRGITVNDSPDHGVMVTVDGMKFPGVKDVPDEEVRNLIRSAVVKWEKTGKSSGR